MTELASAATIAERLDADRAAYQIALARRRVSRHATDPEASRVDGDVITEDSFTSAGHGTSGAELNALDRTLVLRQKRGGAGVTLRTGNIASVIVRSAAANVRVGVVVPSLSPDVFSLGPDAGAVMTNPATASTT